MFAALALTCAAGPAPPRYEVVAAPRYVVTAAKPVPPGCTCTACDCGPPCPCPIVCPPPAPARPKVVGTDGTSRPAVVVDPPAAPARYLIGGHWYEDHPGKPGYVRLVESAPGVAAPSPFPAAATSPTTGVGPVAVPSRPFPAPAPYPAHILTGVPAGHPFGTSPVCLPGRG
jgi:hypothetical protein